MSPINSILVSSHTNVSDKININLQPSVQGEINYISRVTTDSGKNLADKKTERMYTVTDESKEKNEMHVRFKF